MSWLGPTPVTAHTYVLNRPHVVDQGHFARHHGEYLVSIHDEPKRAAKMWKTYTHDLGVGEGWVSLQCQGTELTPMSLWGDLPGFWGDIIEAAAQYLETGYGLGTLYDQPVEIELRRTNQTALFRIHDSTHHIDPATFIPSVLHGALAFAIWQYEFVGGVSTEGIEHIHHLLAWPDLRA